VALLTMARIIARNLFAGPATRRYPGVVRPAFAGSRGRVTIDYPQCIHCGSCARRCPARAIEVGREPKSWKIDNFACVTCGICVQVCPKKCLCMEDERPAPRDFADASGRVESHVTPTGPAPDAKGANPAEGRAPSET
jgi:ech hydrogenase subunit F